MLRLPDHAKLDTPTHTHTRQAPSERVIISSQKPLNTQKKKKKKKKGRTSMPSAGFEPAIPAIKLLQTYALECTDFGIDIN